MTTVTIPKNEYRRLKQLSAVYRRIAEEIIRADHEYPYDYKYIDKLIKEEKSAYTKGRSIEARSVDEALAKSKKIKK